MSTADLALAMAVAIAVVAAYAAIRSLRRRVKQLEDAPPATLSPDAAEAYAAAVRKALKVGSV